MNDLPIWLAIPLGILLIVCWVGGAVAVWRATRTRGRWARYLWRAAAIFFPLTGFVVFATSDRIRRRAPAAADALGWQWIAVHALTIALAIPAYLIVKAREVVHVGERQLPSHAGEWWSGQNGDRSPELCVAMSGGGIRSAAFNIGVLRALHEHRLLARTDVMSAVSGGSYALSWYLLQQYYAEPAAPLAAAPKGMRLPLEPLPDALFDWQGVYQQHLASKARQFSGTSTSEYYFNAAYALVFDASAFNVIRLFGGLGTENVRNASSARRGYRESLQRTFHVVEQYNQHGVAQGAGSFVEEVLAEVKRAAAHVDLSVAAEVTFSDLARLAADRRLPFPIFVTTVRTAGAAEKHPDALWPSVFELNGLGLGSDSTGYKSWREIGETEPRFAAVRLVNVAPAISGAAVSPAAGGVSHRTRRLMSYANVDLGYSVPRLNGQDGSLYLSDGGHVENLGLYPLVRRNCRNIVVIDAEYEPKPRYEFKAYKTLQKALPGDFKRTLKIKDIDEGHFRPAAPVMRGNITSDPNVPQAEVYYVKLSRDDTRNYGNPIDSPDLGQYFPQDPTSNQNFNALRFSAYRELGYVIARESEELKELAGRLAQR